MVDVGSQETRAARSGGERGRSHLHLRLARASVSAEERGNLGRFLRSLNGMLAM